MKKKTLSILVCDDYLDLIRRWPLRRIANGSELAAAHVVLRDLFIIDEASLSDGQRQYLSALGVLVEEYETRRYPMPGSDSPSERLRFVMEESGMTQAQLAGVLDCGQPMVSLLLSGDRQLSKGNIKALAHHFHVSTDYFLGI